MFCRDWALPSLDTQEYKSLLSTKKKKIEIVWYTHIHSSVNNTLKISSMRNLIFMNEKANQKIKLNFLEKSVGTWVTIIRHEKPV